MTASQTAVLGKVSTARGARLHLIHNGQAPCGSGRRHIIPATIHTVHADRATLVCKRCLASIPAFWTGPAGTRTAAPLALVTRIPAPARPANTPQSRRAALDAVMAARRAAQSDRELSGWGRIRADLVGVA